MATLLLPGSISSALAQESDGASTATPTLISAPVSTTTDVYIPEDNLRAALEGALGKEEGQAITVAEMASLTSFAATSTSIVSIEGLEHATGLTELDLLENAISDITPLAGLTSLTSLNLAENSVSDIGPLSGLVGIEVVTLFENSISDIEPLRGMTSLNELHLGGNFISDIEPLSELTTLEILHLWINNLADDDLEQLTGLTGLTELYIDENFLSDIGVLSGLTNLTTLHLTENSISDLSPLSGLTALTELLLHWNSVSDVTVLSGLTGLETLELWHNEIEDISPLSGLTGLKRLDISDNKLTDSDLTQLEGLTQLEWLDVGKYFSNPETYLLTAITPLASLENLDELHVEGNSISDLSPLSGLTGLTKLHAQRNSVSDVSPVTSPVNLEELLLGRNPISDLTPFATAEFDDLELLYLWSCEIEDLSPLSGLTSVKVLHLYGNSIEDVSPLSSLTSLEELHLGMNSISDIGPLSALVNVKHLHLVGNEIEDLSPLSSLISLTKVHMYSNNIEDLSPLSGLTDLEDLHLGINSITDVSPLTGLSNLMLLHLYGNDIEDISPLVANEGLDEGDEVELSCNPLSDESIATHVPALESRGVDIEFLPAPLAPTGLTARVWGSEEVELSWTAPVSTAARTAGYRVDWSSSGEEPWTELTADLGRADTTYYDTGLGGETTRHYRVSTLSRVGDSFPSDVAVATTQPSVALTPVPTDGQTVVAVGRSTLTFSPGSRESDFDALVSAVAAGCENEGEEDSAPGALLECLSVEVLDEEGNRERRPRLQRPVVIGIELSPLQIADAGGAGELYQEYLRNKLRLLTRRDPDGPWKESSFKLNVGGDGSVNARAQTSSLGDFALVLPAPPAPPTPISAADVPIFTGPEPEPPSTGDESVPTAVRLALLASLALVLVGGVLAAGATWRMRRKAKKAATPSS